MSGLLIQYVNWHSIFIERDWRGRAMTDPALAPMRPFLDEPNDLVAVPLPWEGAPIGVIAGMLPRDVTPGQETFAHWWEVAFEAALALQYSVVIRGARHDGTDHERLRLKEELHDTVSQRLFGLSMLTARAEADARTTGDQQLSTRLTELRSLVADASADIRLLMDETPHPAEGTRLSTRLSTMARKFENELPINIELNPHWDDLSEDCTEDVVRIVRECLRNVIKHANATTVSVNIPAPVDGMLLVGVTDNGTGFDPRTVSHDGFGLSLINERALERGGQCEVNADEGGTTISVRFTPEYESDWQLARRVLEAQIRDHPTDPKSQSGHERQH